MRKCIRCNTEMHEGLDVMVTHGGYGVTVKEKGMFKKSLGKLKCALCPECGYAETYLENTDPVKKIANKDV